MKKCRKYIITTIIIFLGLIVSLVWNFNNKDSRPWYFKTMHMENLYNDSNIVCIIDSGYSGIGFNQDNIIDTYNAIDDTKEVNDDFGHGTSMLSLLIGYSYESDVVFGINPKCKVVVIKAIEKDGYAKAKIVAKAIMYASKYEGSIINISLGTYYNSIDLFKAIEFASSKNCKIVASSGDDSKDYIMYPASYENVYAISCQDKNGERYLYANDSPKTIYIPGVNIDVLGYNSLTGVWSIECNSGSSLSSIIFSGLLSLISFDSYQVNYDYLLQCKEEHKIINYNKIMRG